MYNLATFHLEREVVLRAPLGRKHAVQTSYRRVLVLGVPLVLFLPFPVLFVYKLNLTDPVPCSFDLIHNSTTFTTVIGLLFTSQSNYFYYVSKLRLLHKYKTYKYVS